MKKLYVGCALTLAPEQFRAEIENLKESLRKDYEVFDFLGLTKGTAEEVYEWDIHHCVADCDLFLAVCDYPSLGLGYEMATAVEKLKKPTLAVAHADAKVGRIMLGITAPHYEFVRYTSLEQVPALLAAFDTKIAL